MTKRKRTYTVVRDTSVRKSADPESPDFATWLDYEPGDRVTDVPDHANLAGWLAAGDWIEGLPSEETADVEG